MAPGTGIAAARRESRRGQSPPEPEPNGYLWPNIVKFNTTKTEVWIEQLSTGEVKYYLLPALPQDSDTLPGVVDKTGFLP